MTSSFYLLLSLGIPLGIVALEADDPAPGKATDVALKEEQLGWHLLVHLAMNRERKFALEWISLISVGFNPEWICRTVFKGSFY